MTITQFNNSTCNSFRPQLQADLDVIAKKYGLNTISIEPSGKYTDNSFTLKITARTVSKKEDPFFLRNQARALQMLGLPDNSIGRQFSSNGSIFQIDRIDPKKYKMPVIAYKVVGGKVTDRCFKFSSEVVKRYFEQHGA